MCFVRLRFLPVFFGLSLLAGVLGGAWCWRHSATSATEDRAGLTGTVRAGARTVHFEANSRPATADSAPSAVEPTQVEPVQAGPVLELPAEQAGQFAALCELRLLAADTELDLSHREWSTLSALITEMQHVRLAYEAEIAQVVGSAPGWHRVEIPAYAAAGDELRRRFQTALRVALGDDVAAEVLDRCGAKIEALFAGFGVGSQVLEIVGDPAHAPNGVMITRTARYWNSVEGGERVSTRRDVSFPGAPGAATEAWLPLLARVGHPG